MACVHKTSDDMCKKYSSFCGYDNGADCVGYIPSNADRIRAMRDEKLAVICNELCPPAGYTECPVYGDEESVSTHEICRRCWLDWLKQEAK